MPSRESWAPAARVGRFEGVVAVAVLPAVESGDRRAALEALARKLAAAIDSELTPTRDLAALALRLASVLSELEGSEPEVGGSVDDLAAKRASRRSTAAAQ